MKCPFCGEDMSEGRLMTNGVAYFLPEGERPPILYNKYFMDKVNGVMLTPASYFKIISSKDMPKAFCCRRCQKVIIDY